MSSSEITVNIKESQKSYPIIINEDEISRLKEQILPHVNGKILVVISEKVDKLYGKILGFPKEETFVLKDGEKEKNFKNYKKIIEFALKRKLTRKDTIIAIGGGVVGDLAGFVASTYMRGIDFIQVPTTLLACVDSSVGGKVAINTDFGKNLIGSFYQPKAVLINVNFLQTLNEREFKTGLGEVVKYAFIEKSCPTNFDFNLVNYISENVEKIIKRKPKTLAKLIEICVSLKASVVEQDEKEGNIRRILNFGHTYGHAVEKVTRYRKFTHGEAIVEGMEFAINLALKRGLIDKNYKLFMDDLIGKFDFVKIPKFPLQKMIECMKSDKKADSDKIVFILPTDYSTVEAFELDPSEIDI